jgi:hypothetical protein
MCSLCNGTRVVHEVSTYSIRTSCCPVCGPEPDDVWIARMENLLADIKTKKEAAECELRRG